jgi:uncharacterized protein YdcH (DUF465 family)
MNGRYADKGPMMSEAGHDLHTLFPDHESALHTLKLDNSQFRELAAEHHDLEVQIQRFEAGLAATSDEELEALKKKRLFVLDQISALIAEEEKA